MAQIPDLLMRHGAAVLFAWAFAVQAGVPAPAVPVLLGAGALCGTGQMSLPLAVGAAMAATLVADGIWYVLGTSMGPRVLGALGRFSLNPDSFVRHAKERFLAHRMRSLVLAKFLPGLNSVVAGLAGVLAIPAGRFLLYDSVGALVWAATWITVGYAASDAIGLVAVQAARLGRSLVLLVAAALIGFILFKYMKRQRFLLHLRKARITPGELKRRLEAGDHLVIVDLRTALDVERDPYRIPGARLIAPERLEDYPHDLIPPDSEVVFYCEEPREATSARMALRLAALGFKTVHPLSGGLEGWRQSGMGVEPISTVASSHLEDSSLPR